jgi:hypothetical protein
MIQSSVCDSGGGGILATGRPRPSSSIGHAGINGQTIKPVDAPATTAATGVRSIKQVNPNPEIPPDPDLSIAAKEEGEALDRISIHQGHSCLWFLAAIISLLLSGTFAIPVKTFTAWGDWLINWRSNLLLYFAGASLMLSLVNGTRAVLIKRRVKMRGRGK